MPEVWISRHFVLDNRSGSIGSKGAIDIGVTRLENDVGTLIAERGLKLAADEANSSKAYRRQW
ncbi:hypothetical protein P4126_33780 [Pseudomonas aeruginosa]|nr:hypothetical protein [Pseudomonas aeruginosa]